MQPAGRCLSTAIARSFDFVHRLVVFYEGDYYNPT